MGLKVKLLKRLRKNYELHVKETIVPVLDDDNLEIIKELYIGDITKPLEDMEGHKKRPSSIKVVEYILRHNGFFGKEVIISAYVYKRRMLMFHNNATFGLDNDERYGNVYEFDKSHFMRIALCHSFELIYTHENLVEDSPNRIIYKVRNKFSKKKFKNSAKKERKRLASIKESKLIKVGF